MRIYSFIFLLMVSGCAKCHEATRSDIRRDAEHYAIAGCLINQKNSYLKDQGDAWASAVVQGGQLTLAAMENISESIKQEVAKGHMLVIPTELGVGHEKDLPIFYCVEIVDKVLVRSAVEKSIVMTERWLKFRK